MATNNCASLSFFTTDSGHPPLHAANINSSIVKSEVIPLISKLGLSNNSIKDILPFDSMLSYRLIGLIRTLCILPVPECIIFDSSTTVEPVRMYNPSPPISSTLFRTASHRTGAICHSSISLGLSPFNNLSGSNSAHILYVSFRLGSCNFITLWACLSAVVVFPHHFGPTINTAPIILRYLSKSSSM